MNQDNLFTPVTIGPITLRNRSIRSAAFESMCPGNVPSEQLADYHLSVAEGGIGMTTVAYAAVCRSGLSFDRQLWMRPAIVPSLKRLTDALHEKGAKASIQLGHCGNMSHRKICGQTPISASAGLNIYSPTFVHKMSQAEIDEVVAAYGQAVQLAKEAGFDAVEIHAGHGYLISQFLSPYTNHRHDAYGGSLDKRMRFMREVMHEVMKSAGNDLAVLVKTNMYDGFSGGIDVPEAIEIARELQRLGAHALVLSAGFVSRAPMVVMGGTMPVKTLTHYMSPTYWVKYAVKLFGRMMVPTVPYRPAYFLETALKFREALPDMPLIYVGGLTRREDIEKVLSHGFEAFQVGRALVHDPAFINHLAEGAAGCNCRHSNYCIGRMYTLDMKCHCQMENLPSSLQKEIDKLEKRWQA